MNRKVVLAVLIFALIGMGGSDILLGFTDGGDQAIDSDGDGLNDTREKELEIDPTDTDTDDDGLLDGEEVNEYGTDPTVADTDGDGLEDGEEVNNDALSDADPLQKDVFVELDYAPGHKPASSELAAVEQAYDDAPVDNPDGTTGINLHVEIDEEVPFDSTVDSEDVRERMEDHFDHDGDGYRYGGAVNDATYESRSRAIGFSAGCYRNGAFVFETEDNGGTADIFMHELGHSVGLDGDDYTGIDSQSIAYSEYTSVMNYNHRSQELVYSDSDPFDDWGHIEDTLSTCTENMRDSDS